MYLINIIMSQHFVNVVWGWVVVHLGWDSKFSNDMLPYSDRQIDKNPENSNAGVVLNWSFENYYC
jgi:hypothetical protein